ncbi:[FeFe] hydrogenase H-cluster maturation GTPase HydF [Planctomycetales bacterium]|nr:[FeFe] hydrogenase H-cluster maturation GTPase HydF [Planctomycetales bacterium]GHT02315.1 [FeFe] hydrogenase H-cluster maturation GTPase HydF [Planctomycetales bacterium]
MGLNDTPAGERLTIGFFGRRNAGKSSVVNAVIGQDLAVVSAVRGTTTDPVRKAMELLPLGPVLIIDTPGIDDDGALGELRVRKTRQILRQTAVAVLVVDATLGLTAPDEELLAIFRDQNIPYLIGYNKADLLGENSPRDGKPRDNEIFPAARSDALFISATTGENIDALKKRLAALVPAPEIKLRLIGDLLNGGDFVVLVTPIDASAPRGRLILPQQQTIRDILESDATAIVVKEFELRDTLAHLGKKPRFVITDSQVFAKVAADVPPDVPLTSFSILFARYKGDLRQAVAGAAATENLRDGDAVLIAEGCTHHRQCDDIGTVKLPRWLKNYTRRDLRFTFTAGGEFPDDLSPFKLVAHCGACMLNAREMQYRRRLAAAQHVPLTNYGVLIAYLQGILPRCVESLELRVERVEFL